MTIKKDMTVEVEQAFRKPKTRAGKLFLLNKEPKIHENDKNTIFVRTDNANQYILNVMKDIYSLKKPNAIFFNKKNSVRPFENAVPLEFFSEKNDSSLFFLGSHSKKRPNNLVLGRMYDFHVLDMFEFGITNFKSLNDFHKSKVVLGAKPLLSFTGQKFESDNIFKRIKNLLTDVFRGPQIDAISMNGIEHILSFTLCDDSDSILFRSYKITNKGKNEPIQIEEIGPNFDMQLRRQVMASDELFKAALRTPKELKVKKVKNVSYNVEGTKIARIHIKQQNIDSLKTKKIKGLKIKRVKEE